MGKKQNFNERKEIVRRLKYADIMVRATKMRLMEESENVDRMMDIESADIKFNLRLDDWLIADDFLGISDSNDRNNGFPAKIFGFFVPRCAGLN